MLKKIHLLFFSLCVFSQTIGQSFGIRAGLNYSKFSGNLEEGVNESYGLANGFHFGVNYAYKFADDFSIKSELLYTQIGSLYNYDGDSFYKIPINNGFAYEKGRSTIEMKISNAYLSVPISIQWQVNKKIELGIGAYASFLIGPRGNGTIYFEKDTDSLFFKQSLIHNYNSDAAGAAATDARGPAIWVNGLVVNLARDVGAYYNLQESEKNGNLYKSFDFGLTGAFNYFINKGFYLGLRYEIGLIDITNNNVDFLRKTYDETNTKLKLSNHFDRNVGFQFSFGFRF